MPVLIVPKCKCGHDLLDHNINEQYPQLQWCFECDCEVFEKKEEEGT